MGSRIDRVSEKRFSLKLTILLTCRHLHIGAQPGRALPLRPFGERAHAPWLFPQTEEKVEGSRPLVRLGCTPHGTSTCRLSTSSSRWSLTWFPRERSHLGGDFALRCFQRLFLPDLATRHCCWHNNRHTSGRSTPVLSY